VNWLDVLGLSLGLAMDSFAVALAVGASLQSVTTRQTLRLAFHFGLFEFMMPVIGWLAGRKVSGFAGGYDQLAAFALLSLVGAKMLWDARRPEGRWRRRDPTKGLMLVALSLAISLDALAVGMGMALLQVPIWTPAVVIGLVVAGLTAVGIRCGGRIGPRWGRWAEVAGGMVLLAIGLQALFSFLNTRPPAL
jgi:putative Mn2+ efflux pump MntP